MSSTSTDRKRSRTATRQRARRAPQFAPGKLQELAKELGRSPSHLSRFFTGDRPSATLERQIRERYGMSPTRLLQQLAPEPA